MREKRESERERETRRNKERHTHAHRPKHINKQRWVMMPVDERHIDIHTYRLSHT